MRRLLLCATLIFLTRPAPAEDGAPVEIRPGVSQGAKITRTTTTKGAGTLSVDTGEGRKEFECRMSGAEEVAEEALEAKDGRTTRARRRYTKKDSSFEVPAAGKKEEKSSSLTGRLLSLERKDGRTAATCAERNVDPKELASETLDDEWSMPVWPRGPVSKGDEWKADAASVKSWAASRGRKVEDATLSCRLSGFETRQGRRCARIAVDFAARGTAKPGEKQPEQALAWTLKGDVLWSLDDGRAVAFELKGDLQINWTVEAAGGKPAERWTSTMAIELSGEATAGQASFDGDAPATPK